jgi:predicted transposase/invertase (TIGR01784 family)
MDTKNKNPGKYINPFTDFGFKKLFGSQFNKEILISFLNEVLMGKERIEDLSYLSPEQLSQTPSERNALFDIFCENDKGEKFIIELQNVRQTYFKDRSLYYTTFPLQAQAQRGKEWDYMLNAVYFVGILNFEFADKPELNRYRRQACLIDLETHEIFYDKLTFIYLEVPRFNKTEEELVTLFDKWMYVLRYLDKLQERPAALVERIFDRLFREAEIAKLDPKEMEEYQKSLKDYWDEYANITTAKEEGIRIGEEKGRQEEKQEIARQMKQRGLEVELIASITGLSREEVERL